MSDIKTALLINTNSILRLKLIRKVAQLNHDIVSVQVFNNNKLEDENCDYLADVFYTNPELKGRLQNIVVKPDSEGNFDYFAVLEEVETALNGKKSLDLVIDLNNTDPKALQLWDLKLILALFQKKIINSPDSTVIIGNCNYNSNYESSALNTLHNSVTKISRDMTESKIRCLDFTQINALPGDESYIVEMYSAEILRNAFKVQQIFSPIDIIKYVIYAYLPTFLISPIFYLFTLLHLDTIHKQKTD